MVMQRGWLCSALVSRLAPLAAGREWYTSPVITECLNSLQVESLEDIFGAGEYDINPSKLVEFEQRCVLFNLISSIPHAGVGPIISIVFAEKSLSVTLWSETNTASAEFGL